MGEDHDEGRPLRGLRREVERLRPEPVAQAFTVLRPIDLGLFILIAIVLLSPIAWIALQGGSLEHHIPAVIGLALLAVAVGLAFIFHHPTPLQRQILLATFALAGGAIATEIPGVLNVNVSVGEKTGIAAGGAIGVFVILYWFSAPKPPD
jgi:hypothetical protein